MIDFEPTEEQALIIETVRQFAENEIRPVSRSTDEAGAPPMSVVEAAHELGLVANRLPEAFGPTRIGSSSRRRIRAGSGKWSLGESRAMGICTSRPIIGRAVGIGAC